MTLTKRLLGGAIACAGGYSLWIRYEDHVTLSDPFSKHSNVQHKKHWLSGMHEPYLPNGTQMEFITQHFEQFQHLIPPSYENVNYQCKLKTPVHIRRLSNCPLNELPPLEGTVVVGGPPALISTAFEKGITYIKDSRKDPIAYKSALHLEWDSFSEAPTSSQPLYFMIDQLKRIVFPEFLSTAENTGHFSWKSLDWTSWIKNPSKWDVGIRIAMAFQRFTQSSPHPEVLEEVATRTKKNEQFYNLLDKELNQQLLMPGKGSIYIARTPNEKQDLLSMQSNLLKEQREFCILDEKQIIDHFGYIPEGNAFGKKTHDRALSPHFINLLSDRILKNGGKVIDAWVTTIYTDDPDLGGILEYRTNSDNKIHYTPFKKLVMSLGTEAILGIDDKPLFDIVSARGISMIALAHLPMEAKLPPVIVCGDTNHVTKLAGPLPYQGKNLFLLRMTCGACISPTSDSFDYDGNAAVGLKSAVSDVLKGKIEVITASGCNRQVSQYGQIHWLSVPKTLKSNSSGLTPRGTNEDAGCSLPNKSSGIFIQYGAGGGGLTQAPSHE